MKELSPEQRERARDVLERQVQHLVFLVDDLLDVSRITRGMITLQRERILIAAVIARAVETARPMIDARRHTLMLELPDEVLTVEGDKARLVQVVGNILNNAVKFMEPGGQILLKVTREGTMVSVTVKDTGIGIPSEQVPRSSTCSRRSTRSRTTCREAWELDWRSVRRLVEMHGGTVVAHSPGAGQGTGSDRAAAIVGDAVDAGADRGCSRGAGGRAGRWPVPHSRRRRSPGRGGSVVDAVAGGRARSANRQRRH